MTLSNHPISTPMTPSGHPISTSHADSAPAIKASGSSPPAINYQALIQNNCETYLGPDACVTIVSAVGPADEPGGATWKVHVLQDGEESPELSAQGPTLQQALEAVHHQSVRAVDRFLSRRGIAGSASETADASSHTPRSDSDPVSDSHSEGEQSQSQRTEIMSSQGPAERLGGAVPSTTTRGTMPTDSVSFIDSFPRPPPWPGAPMFIIRGEQCQPPPTPPPMPKRLYRLESDMPQPRRGIFITLRWYNTTATLFTECSLSLNAVRQKVWDVLVSPYHDFYLLTTYDLKKLADICLTGVSFDGESPVPLGLLDDSLAKAVTSCKPPPKVVQVLCKIREVCWLCVLNSRRRARQELWAVLERGCCVGG